MRLPALIAAITLFVVSGLPVHADTIQPFNLNATLAGGNSAKGVVDINVTTGVFTTPDFTAVIGGVTYLFNTTPSTQGKVPNPPTLYNVIFKDSLGDSFQLALPTLSLVNYTGSAVCSLAVSCNPTVSIPTLFIFANNVSAFPAQSGSLTPAASPVPEPCSVALLAAGILSIAGVGRRKPITNV